MSSKELFYAIQTQRQTRAFKCLASSVGFQKRTFEVTLTFPFMKLNIVYIFRKSYRETGNAVAVRKVPNNIIRN